MRTLGALITLLVTAGTAAAGPVLIIGEDPPPVVDARWGNPTVMWSTWIRVGYGGGVHRDTAAARGTTPAPARGDTAWEAGFGGDVTLPVSASGRVRIGPWAELRSGSWRPVAGLEVQLGSLPRTLDMFLFPGEGFLTVRAGANDRVITGAVAYGYRAPWDLFGSDHHRSSYMIGARVVASYTRAIDDPRDWTATLGLEVEPVGALRYLLGIRALY